MKAVIIEDSETSRKCLHNLLQELCSDQVHVIGTAECYTSGIEIIRTKKPDLVFLDMELPGGTGLDILAQLDKVERNFSVIVTTDWTKYCLLAIKEGVVDYLIKPIDIDDLMEAVEKAWLNRQKDSAYERTQKNSLMLEYFEASHSASPQIILSKNGTDVLIPLHDIVYCESNLKYTIFHTTGDKQIEMKKKIGDYEEYLTSKGFIRISRSVIVNLQHCRTGTMEISLSNTIILTNNHTVIVSRNNQEALIKGIRLFGSSIEKNRNYM